jgi:hypothetical protein
LESLIHHWKDIVAVGAQLTSQMKRERERDRDTGEAYQTMLRPNTKDKFSFLFE